MSADEVERLRDREVAWREMEAKYAEALNELGRLREGIRRHRESMTYSPILEPDRELWALLDEEDNDG